MKFNFLSKPITNHEGALSFKMTPELELYTVVVTSTLSDSFYEKMDDRLKRIIKLIKQVEPTFVAKLAVYVRQQMYLRTVPIVLTNELAKIHNGDSLVKKTVEKVVQRPDEILELLAYYQLTNKREGTKKLNSLSKQVQKGLASSFNRFDEYQFAKYDRDTAVKLRDALFLVHPKAKDEKQQMIFNKIVRRELATPYTWETELSALGQQKFHVEGVYKNALRAKWGELIDSQKMGYMALLRNLRNILEADVKPTHIKQVCKYLTDPKAVKQSKQLPFRFLAAYRELKDVQSSLVPMVLDALEEAITISVESVKAFDVETRVVIACDVSGSMQKPISAKSKIMLYDIGLVLGMLLQSKCKNVTSGMFGDSWKTLSLPTRNILENVDAFYKREGEVGYSTNGYLVLDDLIKRQQIADKVMMFTDVQLWDSVNSNRNSLVTKWLAYKKIVPNAQLYLFDLAGYGHAPLEIQANDVFLIAGWSDKIFDVLKALEEGKDALRLINEICL